MTDRIADDFVRIALDKAHKAQGFAFERFAIAFHAVLTGDAFVPPWAESQAPRCPVPHRDEHSYTTRYVTHSRPVRPWAPRRPSPCTTPDHEYGRAHGGTESTVAA